MTEIVYAKTSAADFLPGVPFCNARFFDGYPKEGVTKVYVVGDHPEIIEAYELFGIKVVHLDEAASHRHGGPVVVSHPEAPKAVNPQMTLEQRLTIVIPEDWHDMPWSGHADVMTMRQLAALLSDEPILNKAQAVKAIEDELARRASI